jgi:hypothetical protein
LIFESQGNGLLQAATGLARALLFYCAAKANSVRTRAMLAQTKREGAQFSDGLAGGS